MKKDQRQRMVIAGLAALMALVIGVQVIGAGGPLPKVVPLGPPKQVVALNDQPLQKIETPVIARDAFWHPLLKADPVVAKASSTKLERPVPMQPLPNAMADSPSQWIPPLKVDKAQVEALKAEGPKEDAPKAPTPKVEPPKKSLRVCGFLATQTPTLILSMNGEEMKTCTTGQQPWPGVKILEIKIDQATLMIAGRTVKLSMGQEVQI